MRERGTRGPAGFGGGGGNDQKKKKAEKFGGNRGRGRERKTEGCQRNGGKSLGNSPKTEEV